MTLIFTAVALNALSLGFLADSTAQSANDQAAVTVSVSGWPGPAWLYSLAQLIGALLVLCIAGYRLYLSARKLHKDLQE